jgi:hypothetical protein
MTHAMDDKGEADLIAAQQTTAGREKAQRAREQFEQAFEVRIKDERQALGVCILCGEPLNSLARFRRALQHRRCQTFIE